MSCLQPGWAPGTVRCPSRQRGELVVCTEKRPATPAPAGRGANQKASEEATPASSLCADRTHAGGPRTQMGNWGRCLQRLWRRVCRAGTLCAPLHVLLMTQQLPVLVQTASLRVVRSPGESGPGAQSPLVSMAVTEAGVEEREVVAEVLSRAGLGTLQSADLADLPPGSSGRLWL